MSTERMMRLPFAFLFGLISLGAVATADTLCLSDGRLLEGVKLSQDESAVTISYENGDIIVPNEMVLDCIIEGGLYVPRTDEEREKVEKGLVPYDGKWMSPKKRDRLREQYIKERKAVIEEMRSSMVWRNRRRDETKNFTFEATVPKHTFDYFRDLMEIYFEEFSKRWRLRKPRDFGKLKVCFYVDQENYLQVTGMSRNVLAYFRFVEPRELNVFYDKLDRRATEDTMFHEVNHYLQFLIDPGFKYPHFPGESLAEYYGASRWDPEEKELTFGYVQEGRLTEVLQDIGDGDIIGLEKLITTDRMYEHYTWGWTLVHFLMNTKEYAKPFQKFYVGLAKDKGVDRTRLGGSSAHYNFLTVTGDVIFELFKKHLKLRSDEEVKKLEERWHDYIQNTLEVTSTQGLEDAAVRAIRNGRMHKGRRLFEEAMEKGDVRAITHRRYAGLLADMDEHETAIEQFQMAVEKDPLTSDYYIDLGKALILHSDEEGKAEGKRILQLAQELDPQNSWFKRNIRKYLTK